MTDTAGRKRANLAKQTFGRLYVLRPAEDYIQPGSGRHYTQWKCRCECGNQVVVRTQNLLSGNTISCGCAMKRVSDDLRDRPSSNSLRRLHWHKSDPYEDLANAIVALAVDDYRAALDEEDQKLIDSIESFFFSKWFSALTRIDPQKLKQQLQQEARGNLDRVYIGA